MSETFYGGNSGDGKRTVLVINGENWYWPKSKFITQSFNHLPVGTNFTMKTSVGKNKKGGRTLEVEWDSLNIEDSYQNSENIQEYIINNEAAKKNRSIASAKKKIDSDNLLEMSVRDLKSASWSMTKTQRTALIALVIAELGA